MAVTAKEYLEMIAGELGEKFPGIRVEDDDGKAVLTVAYKLPFGGDTTLYITLDPADANMYMTQIMADLTPFFPETLTDEFYKQISDINKNFSYGSVIFNDSADNRYCMYNSGFLIDAELNLSDISTIIGDSITNAELEFRSDEVSELFGAGYKAQG